MALLNLLKTLILPHEPHHILFSTLLEKSGCSEGFIKAVIDESQISYDHLLYLTEHKLTDKKRQEKIRLFLTKRWAMIASSNMDYISLPHGYMNQICIKLAETIVQPSESIAQILMPTIKITDYLITGDSLTDLTEEVIHGQRKFNPCGFMLSADNQAVIPFKEWFESQTNNNSEFFNHLYTQDNKTVPLSNREKNVIRYALMPASNDFFEEFDLRRKLINSQGTLAAAVLELCDALKTNGQSGKGNFSTAHDDVFEHIRQFNFVLTKIGPENQKLILNLHEKNNKTFGEYWNIISGSGKSGKNVGDRGCVEETAIEFKIILEENPDIFSSIKVSADQQNTASTSQKTTSFSNLLSRIQSKLDQRKIALAKFLAGEKNSTVGADAFKPFHRLPLASEWVIDHQLTFYQTQLESPRLVVIGPHAYIHFPELRYLHGLPEKNGLETVLKKKNAEKLALYFYDAKKLNSSLAEYFAGRPYFQLPAYALHQAVSEGDIDFVRIYINSKQDLNKRINNQWAENNNGYSALSDAVFIGEHEIATLLVKAGADISGKYDDGDDEEEELSPDVSILVYVAKKGYANVISAIFERNDISLSQDDLIWAFHYAASNNYPAVMKILLNQGVDINAYYTEEKLDGEKWTALHYAAASGSFESIKFLLSQRPLPDLNFTTNDTDKITPLQTAILHGNAAIAAVLIRAGANYEDASLKYAREKGMTEVLAAVKEREQKPSQYTYLLKQPKRDREDDNDESPAKRQRMVV